MTDTSLHTSVPGTTLRQAALALSCLLALANVSCSASSDRARADGSSVTLLGSSGWDERTLSDFGNFTQHLVFLRLFRKDETDEQQPRLAERWEHSPDYRTWTFHLRRDVRWHDGVPTTAHDVKFTLELLAHPAVLHPSAFVLNIESITVLDDFTLTITYTRPMSLESGSIAFYPKHLLEDLDPSEFFSWDFWTDPVGNGPYRYVRHVPKTMMEFEANPDFYKGKPKIERLVLKFGPSTQLLELLSGNVDMTGAFPPNQIPGLGEDPRFRVYFNESNITWAHGIFWNQRHPLFRDAVVRRALTLAINRRELLEVLNYSSPDLPIFDVIYTRRQYLQRQLPEPLPYDPELAKQLLEAAGWQDEDGDGVRERAGAEARFTLLAHRGQGIQYLGERAAVYVQDQLRRVGIRVDVQILDRSVITERVRFAGEFDAAFYRTPRAAYRMLRWNLFGEGSRMGYHNPELVRLLREAVDMGADPEVEDRIYRELWDIFRADLPITFVRTQIGHVVAHRRIRGLSSPWRAEPNMNMEDLWLEDVP